MSSGDAAGLSADALDFAPDLLAIQERPPQRMPRVLLLVVAALMVLLVAWAGIARLDIIAAAEGRLVPLSFTKVVQPADAGVVSEILVRDGDLVSGGQVLLRLDPRLSRADTQALGTEVALRRLVLRFIDAELADKAARPQAGDRLDLFAQVQTRFKAHREAHLDALAQEQEAHNRARADLAAAQQVRDKLAGTLPMVRQSAQAYQRLVKEGFVGELAAIDKSREAMEKEKDLEVQIANVASLQAAIAQSGKRIVALRSQYRSQLATERAETMTLLNRSDQELEKFSVKAGMLEIRAPVAGVVKDLAVTTRGAVVAAGSVLLAVVPVDEPLQAEVLLKNEDVGFVAQGQTARIKVAAYPFQKYGLLEATVKLVSADSADPKQTPAGQPATLAYRAILELRDRYLLSVATGEKLALTPGMLVSAEIHQGHRSVLEYLLSPVRKVSQEAARER